MTGAGVAAALWLGLALGALVGYALGRTLGYGYGRADTLRQLGGEPPLEQLGRIRRDYESAMQRLATTDATRVVPVPWVLTADARKHELIREGELRVLSAAHYDGALDLWVVSGKALAKHRISTPPPPPTTAAPTGER